MRKLVEYEIDVLRCLNGERVKGLAWGAAMSVAIESLRDLGLAEGFSRITITQAGRDLLKEMDNG